MDKFTSIWRDFSQTGNAHQFQEIYSHHFQLVLFTAFKILKNRPASEDVTQDIFIKLYVSRKRHQNVDNFTSWLNTITIRDSIRKLKKENLHITDNQIELSEFDVSSVIQEKDYSLLLREGIKNLKGKNYALILNLCLEGKGNDEIALILGKNEKYVRDRKVLAKKALKKGLGIIQS